MAGGGRLGTRPGRRPGPALRWPTRRSAWSRRPSGATATSTATCRSSRGGVPYQDLDWGHEFYCIGHLIQAAVAWHRALGDDRLLNIAVRAADRIDREFGPAGRHGIDGHPEIEMALVELGREHRRARATSTLARPDARPARPRAARATGRFGPAVLAGPRAGPRGADGGRPQPCGSCTWTAGPSTSPSSRATRTCWPPSGGAGDDMVRDPDRTSPAAGQPAPGRGVRRPVRAAARSRLRRDVRLDRERDAGLAAAAGHRRARRYADAIERAIYNGVLSGLSLVGHRVLLRESAAAADAPYVRAGRPRAPGTPGSPAPAARRT